jgi:hypothetical protein
MLLLTLTPLRGHDKTEHQYSNLLAEAKHCQTQSTRQKETHWRQNINPSKKQQLCWGLLFSLRRVFLILRFLLESISQSLFHSFSLLSLALSRALSLESIRHVI